MTKLRWFLFSGYRRTDTVLESSHGNMSAHKKFQLKAQNYWLAVDPYMPPRRTEMHNKTMGCRLTWCSWPCSWALSWGWPQRGGCWLFRDWGRREGAGASEEGGGGPAPHLEGALWSVKGRVRNQLFKLLGNNLNN